MYNKLFIIEGRLFILITVPAEEGGSDVFNLATATARSSDRSRLARGYEQKVIETAHKENN